jgi:membrane protein
MEMAPSFIDNYRRLALTVYAELFRTRIFTVAAALAFFFLLSFIPLLLVLASLLAYLPLPNLFGQILLLLSTLLPKDATALAFRVVNSLLTRGNPGFVTIGLIGSLWAASGGFSAAIDALNIAYDADRSRPWWRDRVQALILTLTVGGLCLVCLLFIILGPQFGKILSIYFGVSISLARYWPFFRIAFMYSAFVAAITLLYYLAPTVKQRISATVPGAALAVAVFFAGSFGLSFYIRHFSQYAQGYGALGAVIALMLWLYLVAIAMLVGAEVNAERLKLKGIFLAGQCHLQPGPLLPSVGLSVPHSALTAIRLATPAGLTPRSSITQPPDVAFAPLDGLIALELSPHAPAPALAPDLMAKDGLSPVLPEPES